MSLIRRMSRKISGSNKSKDKDHGDRKMAQGPRGIQSGLVEKNPNLENQVATYDPPKRAQPNPRTVTTSSLFRPTQSSAMQSTEMDRSLFEIPQPDKIDAMTDLIKDHDIGDKFPYVGVVGSEGESPDARRSRLLAIKPSMTRRDLPEIVIAGCPLISREGSFSMESLMEFAQVNKEEPSLGRVPTPSGVHTPNFTISKAFVHIRQITVIYTPNMSSTSNYCRFWMNLTDGRLIDSDKGSQTNVIVSNQEGILEMSCDYCVSVPDLNSFVLSYNLERDIVKPGFQWGTASFYVSITESDLPYQSSKVDAMAVYRMPITTLMKRETNADKSDISFTPADLAKLRDMYMRGDIVDIDEPRKERLKKSTYSKSSIRSKPKGEEIDSGNKAGWEFMKGARKPMVDAMEASIDPDDDEESVELPPIDEARAAAERKKALERYKREQEAERKVFSVTTSDEEEMMNALDSSPDSKNRSEEDELHQFFSSAAPRMKKQVQFGVSGV